MEARLHIHTRRRIGCVDSGPISLVMALGGYETWNRHRNPLTYCSLEINWKTNLSAGLKVEVFTSWAGFPTTCRAMFDWWSHPLKESRWRASGKGAGDTSPLTRSRLRIALSSCATRFPESQSHSPLRRYGSVKLLVFCQLCQQC